MEAHQLRTHHMELGKPISLFLCNVILNVSALFETCVKLRRLTVWDFTKLHSISIFHLKLGVCDFFLGVKGQSLGLSPFSFAFHEPDWTVECAHWGRQKQKQKFLIPKGN